MPTELLNETDTTAPFAGPPGTGYPEHRAGDDLAAIRHTFFQSDCVLVRGLLNPAKLAFFRHVLEAQYEADDRRCAAGGTDEAFAREYANGWIWEPRLREATSQAFGYEDIVASKALYDVIGALMGPSWRVTSASQIRRMTAPGLGHKWGSWTAFHMDAQWGIDHRYCINAWVPFTPCGRTAPGLEFLLAPAEALRAYARYDPSIPYEPKGPQGINPRLDYRQFEDGVLRSRCHPDRFWAPELQPGDVVLFSSWAVHRTHAVSGMTDQRISLEWRVLLDGFDTELRPAEER